MAMLRQVTVGKAFPAKTWMWGAELEHSVWLGAQKCMWTGVG